MSETLKDTFSKLRKESFDQLHWREVIAASNIKQCRAYEVAFRDKAKEFEQNGQTESASACRALQVVSMLNIRLDNPRQPFRESRMTPGVQFPDSGDLGEPLLAILSVLVHEATDPEFKARLADVCWTTQKKRDFQLVAIAIESCIASAETLSNPVADEKEIDLLKRWEAAAARLRRALQLANSTKHKLLGAVKNAFDRFLADHLPDMPLLELGHLLTAYQNELDGDTALLIPIADKCIGRAAAEKKWNHLRHFLRLKANWEKKAGRPDDAIKTEEYRAETYLNDAADNPTHRGKAHFAAKALTACRQISPKSTKLAHFKSLMNDYQLKGMEELETIRYPVGLGIDPNIVAQHVARKNFPDALICLARIAPAMMEGIIRKNVMERSKDPFLVLASQDLIDWDGRVIAKRGSMISDDPDAAEEAIRAEMFRTALDGQKAVVAGLISPARFQLLSEHNPSLNDLSMVLIDSPFIPPGREYFFVRGLFEGLNGDFLIAAHLLIPQLEHALRFHLEQRGADVTTFAEGIQEVMDINKLFGFRRAGLLELLGPNQVFELEGLLIRRYGSNLRNSFAHGLLWPDQFFDCSVIYLWWVTLRLCLIHTLQGAGTPSADLEKDKPPADPTSPP